MKKAALLLIILSFLSGCTLVNVAVAPSTRPLEEKVLEGEGAPKILLLNLDGVISFKEGSGGLGLTTKPSKVAFFREALRKAAEDKGIAGVIVRINSPGGTVAASDTIYHEIVQFKQKRKIPVYAFIQEVGASGGYYVASASDRIIASPAAVTGSIGVLAMKLTVEGLMNKIGVTNETYKSGPKKDFWSPFRPTTPEEQKMLQEVIDGFFSRFVQVVSTNRQKVLTPQEVKALADGRILTARDAQKAGLVDQVAYLDDAIEGMKKALGIEQARVVTYARPGAFKSNIYSEMPAPGPQSISLITINAEEFSPFSGVQFMYLWSP